MPRMATAFRPLAPKGARGSASRVLSRADILGPRYLEKLSRACNTIPDQAGTLIGQHCILFMEMTGNWHAWSVPESTQLDSRQGRSGPRGGVARAP
jgi:hypothetical protein